jgi:hypothetical protein
MGRFATNPRKAVGLHLASGPCGDTDQNATPLCIMRMVPVEPCWRYPDQRQEADDGNVASASRVEYIGCILLGSWLTTMAKPGRNDPCPCGSGNKYKKCCLAKEEAAEREELAKLEARRAESAAAHRLHLQEARAAMVAGFAAEDDERTN